MRISDWSSDVCSSDLLALSAAACMVLRLDHVARSGKLLRGRDGLLDAQRGITGGHGHTEFREQFLGLIFVDVHRRHVLHDGTVCGALKHSRAGKSTPTAAI